MKKMMMMGGLMGFSIGVVLGLVKGVTWPELFLRACVATLLSGLLVRWWARLWITSLKESLGQQFADKGTKSTSPAK